MTAVTDIIDHYKTRGEVLKEGFLPFFYASHVGLVYITDAETLADCERMILCLPVSSEKISRVSVQETGQQAFVAHN